MPNRRDDDFGSAVDQLVASAMQFGDQQGGRVGRGNLGGSIAKVVAMALEMGGISSSKAGTKSRAKPSHAKHSSHSRKGGHAQGFGSSDDDSSDDDSSDSDFSSDSESEIDNQDEDGYSSSGLPANSAGQRLGGDNRPRTAEVPYAPRPIPKTEASPQSKPTFKRVNQQNATSAYKPAYKPAAHRQETSRKIKIESDDDDDDDDDDDGDDGDDYDDDSSASPSFKKSSGYKRPYIEEDGMDFAYDPASNRPKAPATSAKVTPPGKKYKSSRAKTAPNAYSKKRA